MFPWINLNKILFNGLIFAQCLDQLAAMTLFLATPDVLINNWSDRFSPIRFLRWKRQLLQQIERTLNKTQPAQLIETFGWSSEV